jgi:hypothetical protein
MMFKMSKIGIILNWIFKKCGGKVWAGFIWLRAELL